MVLTPFVFSQHSPRALKNGEEWRIIRNQPLKASLLSKRDVAIERDFKGVESCRYPSGKTEGSAIPVPSTTGYRP